MNLKKLSELSQHELNGKKVFVRVDFDVPLDNELKITSTFRIDRCIPTIKLLQESGAAVVLGTKIGRPAKQRISTEVLMQYLTQIFGSNIEFFADYMSLGSQQKIQELQSGRILLLENLRFYNLETATNYGEQERQEVKNYATNFNLYVNEAFAMSHRNETSVTRLPEYLPAYAGLNLEKEISTLLTLLENPEKPLVFIVGGAKIESKLPVINAFLEKADKILIAGKLIHENTSMLAEKSNVLIATSAPSGFDISEEAISAFCNEIKMAKTIVWAGPIGKFEEQDFEWGTSCIIECIGANQGYKVAGGGDTFAAIEKFNALDKFNFISTGGGAMLKFLAGEALPGLDPVKTGTYPL